MSSQNVEQMWNKKISFKMVFVMARLAAVTTPRKTGEEQPISELGRKLRRIAEKIAASGERPLSRRELEREIAQRRGGIH
jgi:hypothetical protein